MPTKTIQIRPPSGLLDTRSTPDEVPFGGYRMVENMRVTQKHRVCTLPGWEKLLAQTNYNNADYHDQLTGYTPQVINYGFEATTPLGFSKLFVASQNRISALNYSRGNYKVISDLLGGTAEAGCSEKRWRAAQQNSTVVWTNNSDPVVAHSIDQPAIEASDQSVKVVQDLTTLNVTKAAIVFSWQNLMFLMNIEMDGQRFSNRIIWSDYKKPLAFLPKKSVSLAGRFDLPSNCFILNCAAFADRLIIYTNRGIWECTVVGGDQVLAFGERWPSPRGKKTLAYKNTLVSTGVEHYYMGEDAIYRYSPYHIEPEQIEWIHRSSSSIFDDINREKCDVHVGGHHTTANEIWWSWAQANQDCPTRTFVINIEYQFASFVDHGFNFFVNAQPSITGTLEDFILKYCICTRAELEALGLTPKEGGFCTTQTEQTCEQVPMSIYTNTGRDLDDLVGIEDPTVEPDADSLFTILGDMTVQDLCAAEYEQRKCNAGTIFIGCSAQDNCLKQLTTVYFRERCTVKTGCGTYARDGYVPLLRSGAVDLRIPDEDKLLTRFEVEAHPGDQSRLPYLNVRIGIAAQAVDPNAPPGRCSVLWEALEPRQLACVSAKTAKEHQEDGTRPDRNYEWGIYCIGRYVFYELTVTNPDVDPVNTGPIVCFSRFAFDAEAV